VTETLLPKIFARAELADRPQLAGLNRPSRRQPTWAVNRSTVKARALGERSAATVKTWRILTSLRCCPRRGIPLLAAITVLQHVEEDRRWSR